MVRFEDGKLNPKATFTALAEFLDIPYTESLTVAHPSVGMVFHRLLKMIRGLSLGQYIELMMNIQMMRIGP